MKTKLFTPVCTGLFMACLVLTASCDKNEVVEAPTVTLEKASESINSVSFTISATNASEVAYVQQDDLSSLPSARAIVTAGTKVSASEPQTVTVSDCTPGTSYYFAAAAVSSDGAYSEVATITLTAAGTDCSFEITVQAANEESISYTVTPSDETVPYVVSRLPYTEYENASDEEIFSAITASITASAESAGQSFSDYLSSIEVTGTYANVATGLTPETSFYIVAVGIDGDAAQTTPLYKTIAATTAAVPEMTFEIEVSEVTDHSANFYIRPSDPERTYVWYYYTASNYAGVDINEGDPDYQEKANQVADMILESQRQWLDQGLGLSTGTQGLSATDLMMDTKYYLYAFAYEPGLGRQSDCELVVFTTEHGFSADEFEAVITPNTVTATMVTASVVPAEGRDAIFWTALAIPEAEYSAEKAAETVDAQVDALVEEQHAAGNTTYTRLDAVTSSYYFNNGSNSGVEIMGLTPATDYVFAVVPMNIDGTANTHVATMEFRTPSDEISEASCAVEVVGLYDAYAAYEANIFEGMTKPNPENYYYIAALKVTKNDAVKYCQYMTAYGGDRTNDYSEYNSDDYLLTWTWTPIDMSSFDENGVTYLFLRYTYYGEPAYGNDNTFMVIARDTEDPKDDSGTWGRSTRVYIKVDNQSDPQLGDISELASLVESINNGTAE